MKIETLNKANQIHRELRKWQDVLLRLNMGRSTHRIIFDAYETKTLQDKYELTIDDEQTVKSFTAYVNSMIKKYSDELENL